MKQVTIDLYEFNELNEFAKYKAIEANRYWNVECNDWHEYTYEDAENVGIKITGFDLERRSIDASIKEVVATCRKIYKNHGPKCETHKIAKTFIDEYPYTSSVQERDELKAVAIHHLSSAYLSMLEMEFAHRTSDDEVIESLICNEMLFTREGGEVVHVHTL